MIKKALSFSLAFVLFMTSAPVSTFAGEETGAVPTADETALTAGAAETGEWDASQYSDEGSEDAAPEDGVVEEDPEAAEDLSPEEDGLSESLSAADGVIEDPDEPLDVYKNAVEVQPGVEYNDFNQMYKLRIVRDGRARLYFNSDLKYFQVPVYTDLTTPDWGSAYDITQWDSFLDLNFRQENHDVAEDGYFYFSFKAYSETANNTNFSFRVYPEITIVTDSDNIHDGGASEAVEAVYGTAKDFAVDAYVPFGEIRYSWGTEQWDEDSQTYVFTPFADDTGNGKYTLSIDQKEDMTLICRLTALPDSENPAETTVKKYNFGIHVTDPAAEAAETLINIADDTSEVSADQIIEVLEDAGSAQVLDQLKENLKKEDGIREDPDALNAKLAEVTAKLDEQLVDAAAEGAPADETKKITVNVGGQNIGAYVAATEPAAESGITVEIAGAASTAASVIRRQGDKLSEDQHYQAVAVIDGVKDDGNTLTLDISLNVKVKETDTLAAEGVEPVSPVTVTVSLPEKYIGRKLKVTHTLNKETGETEVVSASLVDNYSRACFTVSSLSPFQIEALECGHYRMTYVPELAATCNAPGNIAYYECSDCHAKFKDEQGATAVSDEDILIQKTNDHKWDDGVITTPATKTGPGIKTFTCKDCEITKTESYSLIEDMAGKIDFAKAEVEAKVVAGTCEQITVTIPVHDWYTDEDLSIQGPTLIFEKTEDNRLVLQGEYSKSEGVMVFTAAESLTRFSDTEIIDYNFNVLSLYTGRSGTEPFWRFTAAEEEDIDGEVNYCVGEALKPITVDYTGPAEISETEWREIPVGINIYTQFKFKPSETADYYFEAQEAGVTFAFDGFVGPGEEDFSKYHLEKDTEYHGTVTALYKGEDALQSVHVRISQDNTGISITSAVLDKEKIALGQTIGITITADIVGNSSLEKASLIFVNREAEEQGDSNCSFSVNGSEFTGEGPYQLTQALSPNYATGTYELDSAELTDTRGKVFTYSREEMGLTCSFKAVPAVEAIREAAAEETVTYSTLVPETSVEIREGVTVVAGNLRMSKEDATLTVSGVLHVDSSADMRAGTLELNRDINVSGSYVEREGFQVTGDGKVILDGESETKWYRVRSRAALAHLAGNVSGTIVAVVNGTRSCEYKWDGSKWVSNTHIGELTHVPRQDATKKADGHIEYWECGNCGQKFSNESGTAEIGDGDIVIPKSEAWKKLIKEMAEKIDFAHATVDVAPDETGTCAQITVKVPVDNWFTDPELSIVGPGMAFAGDVETDNILLEGEYVKDESGEAMVFTVAEPLTRISGEKEYRFSVLDFYTEEEGTEPFWRLTAVEEAPSLGDVSYCVGEDAVKPFSVVYLGPVTLSETEWTEIPVGIETWFEFEPSDTGDYYAKIDNGFSFAFDGFMEVGSQEPCANYLEKGKKYRGSITPYGPAGSTEKTVSALITQNNTEISVTEGDTGADCYGIGQNATVTLQLHIDGDTLIKKAEVVFVNTVNEQGGDEKRIKLIEQVAFDASSICLSGTVNSNNWTGTYELNSVMLIDTRGKVFTYNYGGEGPDPLCSFDVVTAEELIREAPAGDMVEFSALSPRSDVEIPDGVTVKADNLEMKVPNAKMTVNGTLLVGVHTDLQAGVMELNRDITVSGHYLEREGFRVKGNGKVVLDGTPEKTRYRIYDPDALNHLAGSCVNTVVEKAGDPDTKYYWCGTEWLSAPVKLLPVAGRNATCKEAGWKAYYECEHCHKKYLEPEGRTELTESDILIPKTDNHTWDAGRDTTPATENAPGVRAYTCTVCGTTRTETIPQLAPQKTEPQEIITISKKPAKFKAKAGKKGKVTLTWKKLAKKGKTKALFKQVSKIEIQVSTDSGFAPDVTKKYVLSKKKAKKNLKLKPKTKYFIRIRYTDGKGGYSNWVKKSVKTKK